ncbi:MAG TPA: Crp/Fnr family transcriptional regulator [Caulobacteraceae bacterium]|nr:Crp/Fnr family transcriptional regulator [Caulobacteraceae bacterium]
MNALIQKLERRARLLDEEKAFLADACQPPRKVSAGEDIIRPGDTPQASTLLIEGYTARYGTFDDGRRQLTALHIRGDFVDLHSFLLRTMDHGITALTPCTIAQVPHTTLKVITEQWPHLARVLWLDTLVDGAIHRQWLVSLGRRPALGRLAHLFCELSVRFSLVGLDDRCFSFPLTQSTVGDMLGLSTVHVNRVAQELRAEGVITWRGGRVQIEDWAGLTRIAEFDPMYLQLASDPV